MAQPPSASDPQVQRPESPAAAAPSSHDYSARLLGAVFPLSAGFALYGWRALCLTLVLIVSTVAATLVWRRLGRRGAALHLPQALWMATLLGLMLPPHLLSNCATPSVNPQQMAWAILVGAAILLVIQTWLMGSGRLAHVHPAILAYLALALLFPPYLNPHVVLRRTKVFNGDVLNYARTDDVPNASPRDEGWVYSRDQDVAEALYLPQTAGQQLSNYTTAGRTGPVGSFSLEALLRDSMPPLEDLLIGGHPGPVGGSSAIAVLIGGLFLLHRRLIDYRVPLLIILSAYLALLLLPVPIAITEGHAQWLPMVVHRTHLDWATIITFVNYEVAASPLLLMAFFLANSPCICPAAPKARALYASLTGFAAAACMLYFSCSLGPYIGLALISLLAPALDCRCDSLDR